ncbi:MAG: TlpA disulfide reductase family protein [Ornithinimicrobium sp.]
MSEPSWVQRRRRPTAVMASAVVALALAGCGNDPNSIAEQARAGDNKNYIVGDGSITAIGPSQRETRIELAGTTLEGEQWSSQESRGEDVLVINVWGSWCPPCRDEAADLEKVFSDFSEAGDPVDFIGVNDRDSVPTALAFQKAQDITYPSLEYDGGQTLTQLKGLANARPSTVVLDPEGYVAARVLGPVDATTLRALVQDVLDE